MKTRLSPQRISAGTCSAGAVLLTIASAMKKSLANPWRKRSRVVVRVSDIASFLGYALCGRLDEISVVWESPFCDVRLLVSEMVERMCLAPLVHFIVLIDVPSL